MERPVAVVAAVLMVLMFGVVALDQIPIQLTPDVRKPVLTVETNWAGTAPAEIEREIINRQEEALKGLDGLESIESTAEEGRAQVTLTFRVGQNMDRALLLVANRLDRVTSYPEEVDRPQIRTQGSDDNPIAWFVISRLPGNTTPIRQFGDFIEDFVIDRIERVPGVSGTNFFGGSERELRVVVDPSLMAKYRLTVTDVLNALRGANVAISGGEVDEGKRAYTVRVDGELVAVNSVKDVLVRSIEDSTTGRVARVKVGDVAKVMFAYKKPRARIRASGEDALVFNILRATGANVMDVMRGVRATVKDLNDKVLKPRGLVAVQVYDETDYITSAVNLVTQNIWVGGLIAAAILLLFLRSWRATLVVSLAIPVSVVGSFVAMAILGRSINVISLAGIAFAVGMVVDAAIVVLENIYRHREQGKPIREAAYIGANEVWGAVLVSALTTVMVFIPILTLQLEVGQLFRDIAVAISVSVLLSLLVAVTLIPALANWLFGRKERLAAARGEPFPAVATPAASMSTGSSNTGSPSTGSTNTGSGSGTGSGKTTSGGNQTSKRKRFYLPVIDELARLFSRIIMAFVSLTVRSRALSALIVLIICGGMGVVTWLLLPKLEYLPTGNRNLVLAISLPPPGYNLQTTTDIAKKVEAVLRKHYVNDPEVKKNGLPDVTLDDGTVVKSPGLTRFFFVALSSRTFVGATAADPSRVKPLIKVLKDALAAEPGTIAIVFQPSLFGRGIGGGRSINLDISGPDLPANLKVAFSAFLLANKALPFSQGNQIRPRPGLTLGAPEVRVLPDRLRLADAGVSARDLANTIDVFNDGLRVVEVNIGGRRIDLMLAGPQGQITQTQGIGNIPVVTRSGTIVPVRSLATVKVTAGATEIIHKERARTVTLQIRPTDRIPLEAAMDIVRNQVIAPLEKQGLPGTVKIDLSGEADELTKTWDAMVIQLLLALVIVYLVMAVLFESFIYPAIIMLSVPLATAGGVLGLALLNESGIPQPLDMLTLLGFVILIGTVVNNAILLVHQALQNIRVGGMVVADAIKESTRTRIRPIFMSTLTSVGGMMPLVVFPGAGSELYRGLGSVVLGGLALSAVLTLLIIPPLMTLFVHDRAPRRRKTATAAQSAPAAE